MELWLLFFFRVFNSLFVITYFDPDEYWQCLEIAYCMVFGENGKCHMTWEWRPEVMIRGYVHPGIFSILYEAIRILGIDTRWIIAWSPRLLMAVFVWIIDLYIIRLATKVIGSSRECVIAHIFNWFLYYAAVRTYSNSLEAVLTTVAIAYWPAVNNGNISQRKLSLVLAASCVIVRPSAAAMWVYLGMRHLVFEVSSWSQRVFLIFEVLMIGSIAIGVMVQVDFWGYGKYTFVPWNFLEVNILENIGLEYGIHKWHWYFTQGFPAAVGTWIPFFVVGCMEGWHNPQTKVIIEFIFWGLFIMSVSGHKELRFMLPLCPMTSILVGMGIKKTRGSDAWKRLAIFSCGCNVAVAIFLSRWHQAAPISILDALSHDTTAIRVDFLIKCHATPYWSFVHRTSIQEMRFLDCSPALRALENITSMNSQILTGVEEEDIFFKNPLTFVSNRYQDGWSPTHVIVSSNELGEVEKYFLTRYEMTVCSKHYHTFNEYYVILCRGNTDKISNGHDEL